MRLSKRTDIATPDQAPLTILVPAFVTSELKTAFQIGFMIFIPFLIIDLVVASVLMAMGMMMLSPLIISLPFKIMLFVLVDGWALIIGTLASSFGGVYAMTPEVAVDLFREALWLTTMMVAVLVVPSLLVGLLVAMFQAATQINEQTLSFLPRLLVMLVTLIVAGPWLVRTFMEYILQLYGSIPQVDRLSRCNLLLALTDTQISTWVATFMLPMFRVGRRADDHAGVRHDPGADGVSVLYFALAITVVIVPGLPPMPPVNALDLSALLLIAEQILIGALLGFSLQLVLPGVRDCRADHLDPDGHGLRLHGRPHQRRVGGGDRAIPHHAGDAAVPVDERPPGGVRGPDRKLHHLAGGLGAGGQPLLGTGRSPRLGTRRLLVAGVAGDHRLAGGQHRFWRDDPRGAAIEHFLHWFPADPGTGHGDFLDRHGRHSQSVSTAGRRRLAVLT